MSMYPTSQNRPGNPNRSVSTANGMPSPGFQPFQAPRVQPGRYASMFPAPVASSFQPAAPPPMHFGRAARRTPSYFSPRPAVQEKGC